MEGKSKVRKDYSGRATKYTFEETLRRQKFRVGGSNNELLAGDEEEVVEVDSELTPDEVKGKPKFWTKQEDQSLAQAVQLYGEKMWKRIAGHVSTRNSTQCIQRWKKVLHPGLKKGQWSEEEDAALLMNVGKQTDSNMKIQWGEVSKGIPSRTCKQCRERWVNHLSPDINKSDWFPEEDSLLWKLQLEKPKKWAVISRQIPGRTENMVKIRWNILDRRMKNGTFVPLVEEEVIKVEQVEEPQVPEAKCKEEEEDLEDMADLLTIDMGFLFSKNEPKHYLFNYASEPHRRVNSGGMGSFSYGNNESFLQRCMTEPRQNSFTRHSPDQHYLEQHYRDSINFSDPQSFQDGHFSMDSGFLFDDNVIEALID